MTEPPKQMDRRRERWHFSKEVSLPTVLAVFAVCGAGIKWGYDLESRVFKIEAHQSVMEAAMLRELSELKQLLRDLTVRIDGTLVREAERGKQTGH